MMMRVVLVFAALLAVSCGSTAVAPSPRAAATSSPVTVPPPTPSQSPTSRIVPFPDLTFIVGTNTGDLYFQIKDGQPAGRKVHVCADAVRRLVAYGRRAAFACGPAGAETLYVYDDSTGTTAA